MLVFASGELAPLVGHHKPSQSQVGAEAHRGVQVERWSSTLARMVGQRVGGGEKESGTSDWSPAQGSPNINGERLH